MAQLTEDDIYRTSTQYRLWSFTRESLATLRSATNASAADGVRAAIQTQHSARAGVDTAKDENSEILADSAKEVDCLTVEEEQKLVGFYCVKAMQFADFCEFPTNVKVMETHPTAFVHQLIDQMQSGYSSTVPQTLLSLQFSHDLPSQGDDGSGALPIHQDRKSLHITQKLCFEAPKDYA